MGKLLKEFKEFAIRGNMVDMAIGVVIGAAFGKVVEGIETVDEIAAAQTNAMDKPLSPQKMARVCFVEKK